MGHAHLSKVELVELAIEIWGKYSKRYRDLIPEYERLMEKKRKLNITPLNRVKKSTLEEIPEIEFLNIRNKKTLRSVLNKSSVEEIGRQILEAELTVESYAFRTIESHIYDYKYEIHHRLDRKKKPGLCAYDSEYAAVGSYHV